jgi:hypothetical protein
MSIGESPSMTTRLAKPKLPSAAQRYQNCTQQTDDEGKYCVQPPLFHTHAHTHTHTHIHVPIHAYTCLRVLPQAYACLHTIFHTYTRTCFHIHVLSHFHFYTQHHARAQCALRLSHSCRNKESYQAVRNTGTLCTAATTNHKAVRVRW